VQVLYDAEPLWLLVVGDMGGYDPTLEAVWEEETNQAQVLGREDRGDAVLSRKVTTSVLQG
jgi:hypothetical protein